MKAQRSFRLRPDEDERLEARIVAAAARGSQGDLIRLALYRFFDDPLPPSLVQLANDYAESQRDPVERSPVVQQLADIADRLTDMMQRPAQPAVGELVSGGLDMTSRRRPARPQPADSKKAGPGTAH